MERGKQRTSVGDYVTLQGAAQALGLTYWQLYRLVQKQEVPSIRVGNTRLVRLSDVELAAR
jgi:excisionase family DNA binding protein